MAAAWSPITAIGVPIGTDAVRGLAGAGEVPRLVTVAAAGPGEIREFAATVRIDTPAEAAYYQHGGILPYVLRDLTSR